MATVPTDSCPPASVADILERFGRRVPNGQPATAGVASPQWAPRLILLGKGDRFRPTCSSRAVTGVVAKGCLRVHVTQSDGSERVLYFAAEGWCITDVESAVGGMATVGIDALEPTEIWVIDQLGTAMTDADHRTRNEYLRVFAESALHALQRRLVGALRKSAAARYDEFRRLYPTLDRRIPQYHIAAYLGISPEFLSKLHKTRLP